MAFSPSNIPLGLKPLQKTNASSQRLKRCTTQKLCEARTRCATQKRHAKRRLCATQNHGATQDQFRISYLFRNGQCFLFH